MRIFTDDDIRKIKEAMAFLRDSIEEHNKKSAEEQRETLKEMMELAIEVEDYEMAAEIRDLLNESN